ncbi:MAG TPA: ribonuclease Y, partial [Acholeplasmataceae bacterium]|nr:ribonuclease Y [Acholeplasmataceae bacterium]
MLIFVIASILLVLLGFGLGYYIFYKGYQKAGKTAAKLIEEAKRLAEENRKNTLLETKQELFRLKQENEKELKALKLEVEREIKEKRRAVAELEQKLVQREERLDNRSANLDKREELLSKKEQALDERKKDLEIQFSKVDALIEEQNQKLLQISGLTIDEARSLVLEQVEKDMSLEIAAIIKDAEEKAKAESARKAQSLLANAIQQYASDVIAEKTVSVVPLPNDEMKGRIIGREGRNIRTIEATTGVDIIIDDTPEAVVLSCFDPIRREVARRTLETLVADGRIQPSRIEELVNKYKKEIDTEIREAGEQAVFETGIGKVHLELIKLIGRLKYRTSYGQNALAHSLEVAFLAGKLAAEIGVNETLARRAGLLHDIGKAADADMEGSHVDIGLELAQKFHEHPVVIDAI